jgi:hypothetical protein
MRKKSFSLLENYFLMHVVSEVYNKPLKIDAASGAFWREVK